MVTRLALVFALCAMLAFPRMALADDGGRHHGDGHHRGARQAEQEDAYAYVCVAATIGGQPGIQLTITVPGTTALVYVQGATCPEDASEDFDTLAELQAALSQPNFGALAVLATTKTQGDFNLAILQVGASGGAIITAGGGVLRLPPSGGVGTNI